MRRADRLIKMVHFLRSRRRAVTAQQIAEEFVICKRTVYRDIQDLADSGVPIIGEAGVGYMLDKQYYLPPIAFDVDELEAIALGMSMVQQCTDKKFAAKASNASKKVQAVLPQQLQGQLQQITTYSIANRPEIPSSVSFSDIRNSIRDQQKIELEYCDEHKVVTKRTVTPLALLFFHPFWLLAGWCEKRLAFRHFRLDRIKSVEFLEQPFDDEPGKNLEAYLALEGDCIS